MHIFKFMRSVIWFVRSSLSHKKKPLPALDLHLLLCFINISRDARSPVHFHHLHPLPFHGPQTSRGLCLPSLRSFLFRLLSSFSSSLSSSSSSSSLGGHPLCPLHRKPHFQCHPMLHCPFPVFDFFFFFLARPLINTLQTIFFFSAVKKYSQAGHSPASSSSSSYSCSSSSWFTLLLLATFAICRQYQPAAGASRVLCPSSSSSSLSYSLLYSSLPSRSFFVPNFLLHYLFTCSIFLSLSPSFASSRLSSNNFRSITNHQINQRTNTLDQLERNNHHH